MWCRLVPPVTCLFVGLLAFPLGALQDPGTPSIFVVASLATQGTQRLAPCRPAGLPSRPFPGPELLPAALKPSAGVVPDTKLRAFIEDQILMRRRYRVSESSETADYVFYVQATLGFTSVAPQLSPDGRPGVHIVLGGDQSPNQLVSLAAFVAPAASLEDLTKLAAGLESARWLGYATGGAGAPASPSALVERFHRDFAGQPAGTLAWIVGEGGADPGGGRPTSLCAPSQPPIAGDLDLSRLAVAPSAGASIDASSSPGETRPVLVPAIVQDANGAIVSDLQLSDFHVYENDVEQTIDRLLPGSAPVSVAVVVDTSSSMRQQVRASTVAAATFIDALGEDDAVMVVSFDSRAYLASDLSRERAAASRALLGLASGVDTRFYDTLVATVERLDRVPGRKIILLLTDGLDATSAATDARIAREAVEASDAAVYVLQFDTTRDVQRMAASPDPSRTAVQFLQTTARFAEATEYLAALSAGTGGRFAGAVAERITGDVTGIGEELRGQYVLSYRPSKPAADASRRRIRVEVNRPGVTVRSRTACRARGGA